MTQIELQTYNAIIRTEREFERLNSNIEQLITVLSKSNNEFPQREILRRSADATDQRE